ncbi:MULTISPECIES: alpha/beta fold hydrolase [Gordonia]|uniref:alpha/beta fold hydrolase n=1 Tax=Gordonia TaxID=2053 RepID=UPI000FDD45B9|nr:MULTISPECIES: alpha/beta fold hydrolase [Gordonia]AZZ81377.1 alpha/beta hydrolase [Gordonia alkanivorans]MDH3009298.1 alpha/beta fold hydrolase [Gordonia alkanivorans]MDH3010586.1 alpha/beta fold hydrolase [Gordonia alkanivorans]MDH3018194.1 alpha/beta fold hydrolase [Gordonia alkanivorans]MDH3020046.1 alpha/beta fold hydrolase [Gordonia alkanivorans]
MARPSLQEFADSPDGAGFFAAYDALIARGGARPIDIETGYGVTRVNSYGTAPEAPIVLLPGGGGTSASYVNVAGRLAERRRVHAVDIIGDAGRSRPGPGRPRTADELMAWLDAVFDDLGLETVDLVGHSYGAMIALAYATGINHERVRRLVLLDPTTCFAGLRLGYLTHALPTLLAPNPERQRRFLSWETRDATLDRTWIEMYWAGARFPTGRTIVPKRPSSEALSRLAGGKNVTAVFAPHSRAHDSARVSARVRQYLPDARTVMLPSGTHHTLPLEPADEIITALLDAVELAEERVEGNQHRILRSPPPGSDARRSP